MALAACELEELLTYLSSHQPTLVAVNAPHCPNKGLVRKNLENQNLSPGHMRGVDMRVAEFELRQRDISVSPTSSRPENCAAWVQTGFDFYHKLDLLGLKPFP